MTKQTQERIRKELVEYLNAFNSEHYPTIKPLLEESKSDFFAITGGHVLLGGDACYDGYSVVLGRKPLVVVPSAPSWIYPLLTNQYSRVFDLNTGRIVLPGNEREVVDVAHTALVCSDWDYSKAVDKYKGSIGEEFPRNLDFLKRYVACRRLK